MNAFASVQHVDDEVVAVCNRLNRRRGARQVFAWASRLGDGWCWYALLIALPAAYGGQGMRLSLLMAATGLLCTLIYKGIKAGIRRPRPCEVDRALAITVLPLDRFSFPSGHTLHAAAFTVMACWHIPMLAWLLVPFTALVAGSRCVLGLHWPSDVLAGGLLGAAIAILGMLAGDWLGVGL